MIQVMNNIFLNKITMESKYLKIINYYKDF